MAGLRDTEVRTEVLKIKEEEFSLENVVSICRTEEILKGMRKNCLTKMLTSYNGKRIDSNGADRSQGKEDQRKSI